MGLFSLTQELAIDLGTANTLIMHNGKVVVDEPSIVALSIKTGALMAIGHKARLMDGKTNPNIRTIRPLKDGVIADFEATELMLPGTWNYASPALKLVSDNALADAAASALVTGVEQKLEKAYTAIGIKPGACSYTFNADNTFTAVLGKRKLSGTYTYDAATHAIELKYTSTLLNLGSMKGYAYLDGNSMELVFDCSKLMTFLTKLGSKVSMLSGITKLVENYDGMMIGFGFTK